jgi:DNA mismatch repair ATPase MutS
MLSPLFVAHMYHMSIFIFVHQDGERQYVIIRGRESVVVKSTPNYVVNNYELKKCSRLLLMTSST